MLRTLATTMSFSSSIANHRLQNVRNHILAHSFAKGISTSSQNIQNSLEQLANSGTITGRSDKLAKLIMSHYSSLGQVEKYQFIQMLSNEYQCDHSLVQTNLQFLNNTKNVDNILRSEQRLRDSLSPKYEQVFKELGSVDGGVKFLVDLRCDLIQDIKACEQSEQLAALRSMNHHLRQLLSLWFGVGFLSLERITWQSACDLLQKITEYEGVHPIRNVSDLRVRVGLYRRCYAFFHASMPREPIVVLHTALVDKISHSIQSIVNHPTLSDQSEFKKLLSNSVEDKSTFNTAVFYSITSTQAGLQGIDLGNYLIKNVVEKLRSEYPHLTQFSSLSPIPGFRDWLITEINQQLHHARPDEFLSDSQLKRLGDALNCKNDVLSTLPALKAVLQSSSWSKDQSLCDRLKQPLMQLCARYLFQVKRRGYAINAVGNFHLRNGATLWRINWLANPTARGLTASCGLMVNYRYYLDRTEYNSQQYIQNKIIDVDQQVLELLRD